MLPLSPPRIVGMLRLSSCSRLVSPSPALRGSTLPMVDRLVLIDWFLIISLSVKSLFIEHIDFGSDLIVLFLRSRSELRGGNSVDIGGTVKV